MPDFFETEYDANHSAGGPVPWRRVLVTGAREWMNATMIIWAALDKQLIHGNITVIHGDCPDQGRGRSVDQLAREWAERAVLFGMRHENPIVRHERYAAPWAELGKSAGPIRNKFMANLGADECLAFPTVESRGTISCMKLAQAAGIPVINYGSPVPGFD